MAPPESADPSGPSTWAGGSPVALGFRMPGEFDRQQRTWLAWPGPTTRAWAPPDEITGAIARIANAIVRYQPAAVVVNEANVADARGLLDPRVELVLAPVDDIWIRDTGPSFVRNAAGSLAAISWNFNAWGGKFQDHVHDRTLATRLTRHLGFRQFVAPIVTEGGALHVDGDGTAIVTESALDNPNRNAGRARADIESALREGLGVVKVLWLPGERHDSITDGHVDGLLTYIEPGRLLFETSDDPTHPLHRLLLEQRRYLELATDARGRRLELVSLTRPRIASDANPHFCGIYVNCLILNGAVLVPAFGDGVRDEAAQRAFRASFPGRDIVPLVVDAICAGGGGIHCVTQQQPAAG